ncbi:hypothetical protein BSU04_05080 [Caballeronia sordidicola]|uniref:Uncharacterized protein n=1 Tax=Caballeronia sordidicola TaxID=196367 RepID=A0A226X8G9_CABSO|nr:hypothetical protein BSU04_05080 [Caballeronia sordidicola]
MGNMGLRAFDAGWLHYYPLRAAQASSDCCTANIRARLPSVID